MGRERNADVTRQVANVVGAIFHIVAGMLLARGEMPGEDITLIQPSNYAFVVWAPSSSSAWPTPPTRRFLPTARAPCCGV
jgi:hypothetical protein